MPISPELCQHRRQYLDRAAQSVGRKGAHDFDGGANRPPGQGAGQLGAITRR